MRKPYTQLYLHCVWATWDRLPLITPKVEVTVYACIIEKCHELGCEVIALGGVEDHVHLLVRIPTTLSVAELMRQVKGASSHLMAQVVDPDTFFRWQGAYGAFTVTETGVGSVAGYIRNQKKHHAMNTMVEDWEIYATNTEDSKLLDLNI